MSREDKLNRLDKEMVIRKAAQADLPAIVEMLADDELGKTRENFSEKLSDDYLTAFEMKLFIQDG